MFDTDFEDCTGWFCSDIRHKLAFFFFPCLRINFSHLYCLYEDSNEANQASLVVGGLNNGLIDILLNVEMDVLSGCFLFLSPYRLLVPLSPSLHRAVSSSLWLFLLSSSVKNSSLMEIGRVKVNQHPMSCLCLIFNVALTWWLQFPWNRFVQWMGAVALRLCWINT